MRLEPAPGARLQHAVHDQTEPARAEHRPNDVELRLPLARQFLDEEERSDDDADGDNHLADEH